MVILFVTEHKMQAMFPAQARNVAEAGLRPPPTSAEFMAALIAAQAPKPPPADVALFGTTYAKPAGNRPGTEHNHSVSYRAAIEFVKVCGHRTILHCTGCVDRFAAVSPLWPCMHVME